MAKITTRQILIAQTACIAILLVFTGGLAVSYFHDRNNPPTVPTNADVDEPEEEESTTTTTVPEIDWHYDLSGKKILLSDGTYGEIALPVYADVPACSKELDQIVTRNRKKFYLENGAVTSEFGIDVSVHQKEIDWQKVKQSGVDFAILRVGYRTYGGGDINADTKFLDNYRGATAAGIKVGAYFFSQAITEEEAIAEAQFVAQQLRGLTLDYPVIYDWELIYDDTARTDNVPCEELTNCCIAFCDVIEASGFHPMIYQNKRTTLFKLDLPRLQDYDFWLAEYSTEPTYYYDFDIWQYSCKGSVPGIEGDVDLNISFVPYSAG